MRLALLITLATAAGLGACAPVPVGSYGYGYEPTAAPAPSYGYYDRGYAPAPYYAEPAYAPGYVVPGPSIVIGGERRFDRGDGYRYEQQRNEGAYRGNPNPPNRDYGRGQPQQNYGGNRPAAPTPVATRPQPAPQRSAPPSGGAAFERWNRANVNAAPSAGDSGPH